jgi:putative ABC transport system permease protein
LFRNYLVIALRNIARHKLYSFINIAGLAVGLACMIFVMLFVRDELSWDRWLPGTQNLYRVETGWNLPGRAPFNITWAPFPMVTAMKEHIPEVTAYAHIVPQKITVSVGTRQFAETVDAVDPHFFQVIRLPLAAGDPKTVLAQPESVVLSQATARKYFGDIDPVGRFVNIGLARCGQEQVACPNSAVPLKVTGVLRDLPHNSQFTADLVIPNTSSVDRIPLEDKQAWAAAMGYNYVALAPGSDPDAVLAKLSAFMDRAVNLKRELDVKVAPSKAIQPHMTRLLDVHLRSGLYTHAMTPPGSLVLLYGLSAIGVVILLVACFNFTNLATARAMVRAREISLRKCVGASRGQLIVQFLGESVLMAVVALAFALAMVEIFLPSFGGALARPITFGYFADWPLVLAILTVAVFAGLISGIYPALVLSGFRPATVLRANRSGQGGSGWLRTLLVVLQFAVSIGLGITALVIFRQVDYARHIDLGFRKDNIVVADTFRRMTPAGQDSFAQILTAEPGVIGVARSSQPAFHGAINFSLVRLPGESRPLTINKIMISPNFPQVYGMRLMAGRQLYLQRGEDRLSNMTAPGNEGHNILINQAAASRFGWSPKQAVGKTINYNMNTVRIVGVLADAKVDGARDPVGPTVLFYDPENISIISIRMRGDAIVPTLAAIDRTWHRLAPSVTPLRYFVSDDFEKLFQQDERQGRVFGVFVAIAISIAALGLFGLAAFTAGRRTKEIGIRKVFGARTRDVVALLLWQFSVPVLIANVIAWPLAWYYLHGWLQGFAYRIALSPFYFVAVGFAALLIAWATILAHALRVARANPIHALRYE